MGRAGTVVVLTVMAMAGCHGGAAGLTHTAATQTKARPPVPSLSASPGWIVRTVTVGGIATAEASTAPLRDPAGVFPDVMLRRLPASGIVIFASGYQEGSPPPPLPAGLPLPYRLSEFRRNTGWEGQPAVNVPQYVLATSRGNHLLDVRVFFQTQTPGDRLVARAQAELATLTWG